MNSLEALTASMPKRIVRNWQASVMRTCDFCGHHKGTVLNGDNSSICASCCDAENYGNLQCALEEALERNAALIAALEQAQQERKVQLETIASVTGLWNEQRNRIAELKTNKPCVKLPGERFDEDGSITSDFDRGWNHYREDAMKAIRSAGGTVIEGE
ncbi:hypothetical protein FH968_04335 [Buttiauxella sp. B2]|uniref:hypothetical protein n=1 Tax=Buttiauxella sp. B2 TaxID=2587812 RepID=UPI001123252C|nr:hypothetical protein [Buttiauxella sp. B2]TNV22110.1 hypothetical protein FH968_04335 [Buttiauxella sp. B2]